MRHLAAAALVVTSCCPKPPSSTVPVVQPPAVVADAAILPPDAAPTGPPVARTVDVVDHEFGIAAPDPYRWMEGQDNGELTGWLRAQGELTAGELAKSPGRGALLARIRDLGLGVSAVWGVQLAGKRLFHDVLPAGEQLGKLAVREADGTERVLVDPAALAGPDGHVSINAYSPSPDGSLVAYVISGGGAERGTLHVMDVATGKDMADRIERIWGEGSASWLPDGKSFFYTQLAVPQPGADPMANQIARWHRLGDPVERDVEILGRGPGATLPLAPEEWPGLWAPPGTPWVMAFIGGAHAESRIAIAKLSELDTKGTSKTPWRKVADYSDAIEAAIPHGDRLYLLTYKDAPNRKIISVPIAHPGVAKAKAEIAETRDAAIDRVSAARDALYIVMRVEGRAQLLRWPWRGKPAPLALPYEGWAPDIATDPQLDGIVFQIESWLRPGTYFKLDARTQHVVPTGLASTTTADFSAIAADEVLAASSDGTQVPLTILHRQDLALDGTHPAIVHAYGAYGASQSPGFSASRLAWLERGGVLAIAHVRGGGERGRGWQDAGSREHKLDGVHDLIACAEALVSKRFTVPGKLAATGGSMGGVLIGRALTERPDLFAAINIGVGIVNPLRILAAENGANQKTELGDPGTEAGYRSILAMDPYQHVTAGTAYPAVIFTIGLNDHRVAPWMTGKMAARLLASTTSKRPIRIRVDPDAGHGIGSTRDQAFAERADVWTFFLGVFGESGF